MDITQLISNLGFPIVCVIGLAIFLKELAGKIMSQNTEREAKLFEMIGKQEEMLRTCNETNAKFLLTLEDLNAKIDNTQEDVDDIKNMLGTVQKEG